MKLHTTNKHRPENHPCNMCDKSFQMINYHSKHALKHNNNCESCNPCSKVTYTEPRFQNHINKKHVTYPPQLDGNNTLSSWSDTSSSLESIDISSSTMFSAPLLPDHQRNPRHLSKKKVTASFLPNIMVGNHRSIFPKFYNLIDEIIECDIHLGLHSEIWEDKENNDHKVKVEKALELHGILYISNPRPKRRGGGAAITLFDKSGRFTLSNISVHVPPDLEVCWGLVRIKGGQGTIREIIVCAFYCPPRSRKKSKLIEHISVEYFKLKSTHTGAAFICGGDKNDLDTKHLLEISSSFRQIVNKPTYKNSVLDILVTDIGHFYNEPVIRPPIAPDVEGQGVPSDHNVVYVKTIAESSAPVKRSTITKTSRPLTTIAKQKIANWIQEESWSSVSECSNVSLMVEKFSSLVSEKLDELCPVKTFKVNNLDNDFTTPAIKELARKKLREYTKHGNSKLFKHLKKALKKKIKSEGKLFIEKQISLAGEKGCKWIRHTASLQARPGAAPQKSFTLPDHLDSGLSALQSAEKIADFFSKISQEYDPLNVDNLPERVKLKLLNDPCDHPVFVEHEVYADLSRAKKTCSVPGDIPANILDEFLPEFVKPITDIFNATFSSHEWPSMFKKEYGVPIEKVPDPQCEDDLRSIGLTPFISKRMEKLLIKWIWKYICPHIKPDQLGGIPDCSIVHYIIRMIDFILKHLDNNTTNPSAVLGVTVDFSKAFNRMSHNIIITVLSDLNIPTCALRLIVSYLSGRSMCIRYAGQVSSERKMPGGGPQGTLLIVLLFILQVNLAGAPCLPPPTLPPGVAGPEPLPSGSEVLPCHDQHKTENKKFVDDLTMLEAVSLDDLIPKQPFIGPLNFHERHGLILPRDKTISQHKLKDLHDFTIANQMVINSKKTKIIPFNFSKTKDFIPDLSLPNSEPLEVVYETKLVGLIVCSSLSWGPHIEYIVKNANKKLWLLIRFKSRGGSIGQLLTLYHLKIRSILEFGSPAFHSSLTLEQSKALEVVQKKAFSIILGPRFKNYSNSLKILQQENLSERRLKLCENFALKCLSNPRHSDIFKTNLGPKNRHTKMLIEPKCNSTRYYNSAVPFLTRLLNDKLK